MLRKKGMKAGVIYHDGQFDDSRLAINIAQTAVDAGACVLNYMKVTNLIKQEGKVCGVEVMDMETGEQHVVKSKVVINATGVFADDILQMDEPGIKPTVRPSQGVHLVLDASFLQSNYAVMIPKTADGRVLFAVPWHDKVVVGTTDTLMKHALLEPVALEQEIDFILNTAGKYLTKPPQRKDVLSVFAGLRPLAAPRSEDKKTKEISRSHKLIVEKSGLITIIGGKWTTYRKMAQDTIDLAYARMHLKAPECVTETYKIHGCKENPDYNDPLYVYGTDAEEIRSFIASSPTLGEKLHPQYTYSVGEIIWIVRNEMALTLEDVLARRLRILFLDAKAAWKWLPEQPGSLLQSVRKTNNG
jgi:Glycerol-3-phosphate dehydrogenase